MNWVFVLPQTSYVEALILNVTVFENKFCEETIKFKWRDSVGTLFDRWCLYKKKRSQDSLLQGENWWEGKGPFANKEMSCHQEPKLFIPSCWTSQPPEPWENKFLNFKIFSLWYFVMQAKKIKILNKLMVFCLEN